MKRPVLLIVGIVAGALLVAAAGASAHSGLFGTNAAGVNSAITNDESSGARTETPEPTETPEATQTPETEAADNDEQGEDNDEQGENETKAPATTSGEHDSGDDHEGSSPGKDD